MENTDLTDDTIQEMSRSHGRSLSVATITYLASLVMPFLYYIWHYFLR